MAAQQLEDKLTCSICLLLYRDPATLPCGHNFCAGCIGDWWDGRGKECPECREPFPDGTELRRNVALSSVTEVVRQGPGPGPGPGPVPDPRALCPRHGWPLELFCSTEGRCVCSACTVLECRHHERVLLHTERLQREAQLRTQCEATQQLATQAKSQLHKLHQQSSQIQSSASTLASVVSAKFSCLIRALEMRQTLAERDIDMAKTQALTQVQEEEQRLQSYLQTWAHYDAKTRGLLEQQDDRTFLQESQHLVPLGPLGPLTLPQWDENQLMGSLKQLLSQLCDLLLDKENQPGTSTEATNPPPLETPGPPAPLQSPMCPVRKQLWQNYRNLTFDPDSANHHLHLSRQNQRVKHCRKPRGPAEPRSFELWQVQCAQSFHTGRHYWEVRTSSYSVTLGVAYPELPRQKQGCHTDNIGRGPSSWGLCIQEDGTQIWHDGQFQRLPKVSGCLLGMDLDLTSGHLTFYSLEPETKSLHTFHTIFTKALYPVFWLLEGRSLTLCHQAEARPAPGLQEEPSGSAEGTG